MKPMTLEEFDFLDNEEKLHEQERIRQSIQISDNCQKLLEDWKRVHMMILKSILK